MVAGGERVYVCLGYGESVTVLDASTGEKIMTLAGTDGARELLMTGEVLYVLADDMTAVQHEERKEWIERTWPTLDIWYRFPRKAFDMYGIQRIAAINTATGKLLWKRQFKAPGEIAPTTMAVDDGKICFQSVSHVVCLDAVGGNELWRGEHPVATSRFSWSTPTLVIHDGVVLTVDRNARDNADKTPPARGSKWIMSSGDSQKKQQGEMVVFSLDNGSELWRAPRTRSENRQDHRHVTGPKGVGTPSLLPEQGDC
jgi:outer membrane protein assembly factor BamB